MVGKRTIDVKVKGRRLSDNGAITRRWALAGYGIALKSWLDVCEDIGEHRLVQVLPAVCSESYPILLATSSRARAMGRMQALGDWLSAAFAAWSKRHPLPMANSRRQRHT